MDCYNVCKDVCFPCRACECLLQAREQEKAQPCGDLQFMQQGNPQACRSGECMQPANPQPYGDFQCMHQGNPQACKNCECMQTAKFKPAAASEKPKTSFWKSLFGDHSRPQPKMKEDCYNNENKNKKTVQSSTDCRKVCEKNTDSKRVCKTKSRKSLLNCLHRGCYPSSQSLFGCHFYMNFENRSKRRKVCYQSKVPIKVTEKIQIEPVCEIKLEPMNRCELKTTQLKSNLIEVKNEPNRSSILTTRPAAPSPSPTPSSYFHQSPAQSPSNFSQPLAPIYSPESQAPNCTPESPKEPRCSTTLSFKSPNYSPESPKEPCCSTALSFQSPNYSPESPKEPHCSTELSFKSPNYSPESPKEPHCSTALSFQSPNYSPESPKEPRCSTALSFQSPKYSPESPKEPRCSTALSFQSPKCSPEPPKVPRSSPTLSFQSPNCSPESPKEPRCSTTLSCQNPCLTPPINDATLEPCPTDPPNHGNENTNEQDPCTRTCIQPPSVRIGVTFVKTETKYFKGSDCCKKLCEENYLKQENSGNVEKENEENENFRSNNSNMDIINERSNKILTLDINNDCITLKQGNNTVSCHPVKDDNRNSMNDSTDCKSVCRTKELLPNKETRERESPDYRNKTNHTDWPFHNRNSQSWSMTAYKPNIDKKISDIFTKLCNIEEKLEGCRRSQNVDPVKSDYQISVNKKRSSDSMHFKEPDKQLNDTANPKDCIVVDPTKGTTVIEIRQGNSPKHGSGKGQNHSPKADVRFSIQKSQIKKSPASKIIIRIPKKSSASVAKDNDNLFRKSYDCAYQVDNDNNESENNKRITWTKVTDDLSSNPPPDHPRCYCYDCTYDRNRLLKSNTNKCVT